MSRLLPILTICALMLVSTQAMARSTLLSEAPVAFTADTVTHDDTASTITAEGNVELMQSGRILKADRIVYHQKENRIVADGNLVLMEQTGETFFGDHMELTGLMGSGFIEGVSIRLEDDSRLAARKARRKGNVTEMEDAIYSPCKLCADNPEAPPIWQIRAKRVRHDNEAGTIAYDHARLEMAGIPVFYTPYFMHPDPTVERQSGFLAPRIGSNSDIGMALRTYYYWNIAPSMDATLEASIAGEGALFGIDARHRFTNGQISIKGALAHANWEKEAGGATIRHTADIRAHIDAEGLFDINPNWRAGFNLARVSDDNFLGNWELSNEDMLHTRLYAERFTERDYTLVEGRAFQDLRPGDQVEHPRILPAIQTSFLGAPGDTLGGRWQADMDALNLNRDTGSDTSRIGVKLGWERRWISRLGLVTDVGGSVRTDAYRIDDLVVGGIEQDNETITRVLPEMHAILRYPLTRTLGRSALVIEPILALHGAPTTGTNDDIPNEDSQDVEIDTTNLLAGNRFPGTDKIEDGTRAAYALRASLLGGGASYFTIGQSVRFSGDNPFPTGSGLDERWSDIVGRLQIRPIDWLDLDYRFQLDNKTMHERRHEFSVLAGKP
ncbi:MAG: LPS assembly protein LptD, partial [Pseudomonadota bacterium]|nr:LPS assembly protein LptD [Pseudomonadota bacterium]